MAGIREIIDILLRTKADTKGAKEMESAMGAVKSALGALGLTIGAKEALELAAAWDEAARAGKDAMLALDTVTGGATQTAEAIEQARQATRNMVDDTTLANQVYLLLDKSLASNSEEAAKLAQASSVLVSRYEAMGASTELFNRLLDTGNKTLIDNFGLASSQVEALQQQIEKTQGLSAEEAKLQAIKELLIEKADQLKGSISDETIAAEQANAALANLAGTLGGLLSPAFEGTKQAAATAAAALQEHFQGVIEQQQAVEQLQSNLVATSNSFEEYQQKIVEAAEGDMQLTLALARTEEQFKAQKTAAQQAAVALHPLTLEAEAAAAAQAKLAQATADAAQMQEVQASRMQGLANAYRTNPVLVSQKQDLEAMRVASVEAAQAEEERQKEQEKAAQSAARDIASAMEREMSQAANQIASVVGTAFDRMSEVIPGLSDMFGAEDPGEFGRRLQALVQGGLSGLDATWKDAFLAQMGDNPVYAALKESIESGQSDAIASEAGKLMSDNLAQVMATGLAESMRAQIRQQNLMAEVQKIVAEELGNQSVVADTAFTPTNLFNTEGLVEKAQSDIGDLAGVVNEGLGSIKSQAEEKAIPAMDELIIRAGKLLFIINSIPASTKAAMDGIAAMNLPPAGPVANGTGASNGTQAAMAPPSQ